MKFGVRVGMLGVPFEEAHEVAGGLGFDGVELEVGPDAGENGSPLFCEQGRAALMARMAATGVATPCVCIGAFWKYSPAADDPDLRATALDLLTRTIEACAAIGADCILVPLTNADQGADDSVPRWLDFLRQIAPVAEQHGITLALEACTRPGMATDEDTIAMADAIGSPRVAAYLDVANIRMAGTDSVAAVHSFGQKYLAHVHMKDLKENPPGSERPFSVVGIGEGMLDFPGIVAALREVGYDGWLTLETPGDGDPQGAAKCNLEALKALLE